MYHAVFVYRLPQPPSGGCVLKQQRLWYMGPMFRAAAFGRLCVETDYVTIRSAVKSAAAFGRLCVETAADRLPVLVAAGSRLRAAVC